jgi:hypothetical protein
MVTEDKLPAWRMMQRDTSPEAETFLLDYWRQASPSFKMKTWVDLNTSVRKLALIGLRNRNPGASEDELQRLLADLLLGHELATKIYGPLEEVRDSVDG